MKKQELIERIEALEKIVLMGKDAKFNRITDEPQEAKLIMSINEIDENNNKWWNENGNMVVVFGKLKQIEQQWNYGKEFDWHDESAVKHSLFILEKEWHWGGFDSSHQIFNFHTKHHAELFVTNFAKELEMIKQLFS